MSKHAPQGITSIADLAIWQSGRLPNGILAEKWTHLDRYIATKDQLVAAGFAKAEWFPTTDLPGKRVGTIKRNFEPAEGVSLTQLQVGNKWEVKLPISKEEAQRRQAESQAKERAARDARDAQEREQSKPCPQAAAFAIGDRAVLFNPGDDLHLHRVIIIDGYKLHGISGEPDQYGYIVCILGDASAKTWFVHAFRLREYAHKPFHVRLAVDNTRGASHA